MHFSELQAKDRELNRKHDFIDRNDASARRRFASAELEIRQFIEECIECAERVKTYDQYSWICSAVTRWANFLASNTGRVVPSQLTLNSGMAEREFISRQPFRGQQQIGEKAESREHIQVSDYLLSSTRGIKRTAFCGDLNPALLRARFVYLREH